MTSCGFIHGTNVSLKESMVFIFKPKISRSEKSEGISKKQCLLKWLNVRIGERRNMKNQRRKEN